MEELDKIIELKALNSEFDTELEKVLHYAFTVVITTKEYQNGTVARRLELLNSAFSKIKAMIVK